MEKREDQKHFNQAEEMRTEDEENKELNERYDAIDSLVEDGFDPYELDQMSNKEVIALYYKVEEEKN